MISISKNTLLKQLKDLPDEISIDELMERFLFIYQIELALEQSKKNQITPHEEVKAKYKKWDALFLS